MSMELNNFRNELSSWNPDLQPIPEAFNKDQVQSLKLLNQLVLQDQTVDAKTIKKLVTKLRDGYLEKYDSKWMHPVDGILTIFGKKTEKDEFLQLSSALEEQAAQRSSTITRLAQAGFQALQGVFGEMRAAVDVSGQKEAVEHVHREISSLSAQFDAAHPSTLDAVEKVHGLSTLLTSVSEDLAIGGSLQNESSTYRKVVGASAIKMGEVNSDNYKKNISNFGFRAWQGVMLMFTGKTDDDRTRIACKNIVRLANVEGQGKGVVQLKRVEDYFTSKLRERGIPVETKTESAPPSKPARAKREDSPEVAAIKAKYRKGGKSGK